MAKTLGKTTAILGSVALVSSGLLTAAPALAQDMAAPDMPAAAAEQVSGDSAQAARQVEGMFSFTQEAISENSYISGVFKKAVASLCSAMPEYQAASAANMIINCGNGPSIEATVASAAEEKGAKHYTVGCACSSNVAGGGAVINAEVSGVSLESVAQMAGAR